MNNIVLVTGSSGFIGSHLVKNLQTKKLVRAAVRTLAKKKMQDPYLEVGEINSKTKWQDALVGVDCIVHLAAVAHNNSQDPEYINEVNVNGTIHLAQQAVKYGVKRFIFISSINVQDKGLGKSIDKHSSLPANTMSVLSKLSAEKALLEISKQNDLEVVIIRPVLIYGLDAPGNFGNLVNLVNKLPLLPFGCCNNKRSFLSIDNLVDFISLCIDHPKAKNEVFCLADRDDVSIRELTNRISSGLNKTVVQLPIPIFIFKALGKITRKSVQIELLIGGLQADSSKAYKLLDWTPPITMQETLNKLVNTK